MPFFSLSRFMQYYLFTLSSHPHLLCCCNIPIIAYFHSYSPAFALWLLLWSKHFFGKISLNELCIILQRFGCCSFCSQIGYFGVLLYLARACQTRNLSQVWHQYDFKLLHPNLSIFSWVFFIIQLLSFKLYHSTGHFLDYKERVWLYWLKDLLQLCGTFFASKNFYFKTRPKYKKTYISRKQKRKPVIKQLDKSVTLKMIFGGIFEC